jgi:membrane-associated phospholipid phosphatase
LHLSGVRSKLCCAWLVGASVLSAAAQVQSVTPDHSATEESADRYQLQPGVDPENRLVSPFVEHLAQDQKQFWTAPTRIQSKDLKWIVPFAAVTSAFIASDSWWSKQVPLSHVATSKKISDYGTYSLIGVGGTSFLLGHLTRNDHLQEAGLLGGEAAINSTLIAYLLKGITERQRPYQGNGNGDFFKGGSSFPSEHSAIAWSVASVWAHEYPGTISQVAAYGLASAVTMARVTAKQHFPTDVVIGSALGWYFGRQVYRAHHDPELGGSGWGNFIKEEKSDHVRNPDHMGSAYVPMDSWVYSAFDRLIALGYVQNAMLGIRPWTRMECARLVEEASEKLSNPDAAGEAAKTYRALSLEFTDEMGRLDGARNLGVEAESVYSRVTNISGRPLRDGYHFGQTIINDFGRPYGAGTSVISGASAHAEVGPLAFYARGEYQTAPSVPSLNQTQLRTISSADFLPDFGPNFMPPNFSVNTGSYSRFELLEGTASLTFQNLQVSVGKQSAYFGPSDSGPLLFSDNAAPILMLKIDTTTPYRIPLLSKLLGPARSQFLVGQLSGHEWIYSPPTLYGPYPHSQPYIHADKVSFRPTPNFEFGLGITAQFAGAGLPFTWRNFVRTYYAHVANLADNPGKRLSQVDFNYRVPHLRNWLTIYADSLVVDEYSPIGSTRASVNPGFYLPQLPKLPKLELRAEFIQTSHHGIFSPGFVYTDRRYVGGYTNDGFLLGSWLGRAGKGGQAWTTYSFSPRSKLQFAYRQQQVDKDFIGGGHARDASARAEFMIGPDLTFSGSLQYEKWAFPVLSPRIESNWTSSIGLTFWPHWSRQ